ncbi:Casein kinase II subunit beta [Thelohanellus kitauei]|uniref:Casein kinase II subunit beta n=1 Tax=Thelohanellus kitauei TaxID=669202 RepID=A0A0C2I941_THEKT|nr:Casein kinase II subunit beta [Thelohanellus kitauei]
MHDFTEAENFSEFAAWLIHISGYSFMCHVDREYLLDRANSEDLANKVPDYEHCLKHLRKRPHLHCKNDFEFHSAPTIPDFAYPFIDLYGLIHARYILTPRGMAKMIKKWELKDFGTCRLNACKNQAYLPIGLSDELKVESVRFYCPSCDKVYESMGGSNGAMDGSFIGTTFPHLLLMTYPERRPPPVDSTYVPKIYDFKLHPRAYEVQYVASEKKNSASGKRK